MLLWILHGSTSHVHVHARTFTASCHYLSNKQKRIMQQRLTQSALWRTNVQVNACLMLFHCESLQKHGCINSHYGLENKHTEDEDEISICWQKILLFCRLSPAKVNHSAVSETNSRPHCCDFFSLAFFIIHQPPLLSSSCLALFVIPPAFAWQRESPNNSSA